ncbi:AAA family ATPase [bacterium]|nr:AAA family ATPase [bacterium]
MMTRSRVKDTQEITATTNEEPKKKTTIRMPSIRITLPRSLTRKRVPQDRDSSEEHQQTSDDGEEDLSGEDTDEDEEDDKEQEYLDFVPSAVLKDPASKEQILRVIRDIEKESPSIEKLLATPMRRKHKAEILDWIMIYENSMPFTEERKVLRRQIQKLTRLHKKEYPKYLAHKTDLKKIEKKYRDYNENYDIQYRILTLQSSQANKEAIYRKYLELLEKMDEIDEEYYKLKAWIKMALDLPHDRIKQFPVRENGLSEYLVHARRIFDEELYGMDKVKEQLLIFIHNKLRNPSVTGSCLGLVGEPGVGKTSIARCLAKVLDFPFEQITFGGVNSAEFLRGFDYTYVGSKPGEIVRCLSRMGYKNGILFFDEYEKISQNKDILACLLHLTDFTQNNSFRDNYLSDVMIDLSSIWFIYSMNSMPEDEALRDRIYYIRVDGYKPEEKVRILKDYLLPKHLQNFHLAAGSIVMDDEIARHVVNAVSKSEKGIRSIERAIKDILGKASFLVTNQKSIPCSFALPDRYYPYEFPIVLDKTSVDVFLKNFHMTSTAPPESMYL